MFTPKKFARGRSRPVPGQMNKTEVRYSALLEDKKRNGQIMWFGFQTMKFRLADNTFYTPDFMVMANDFTLEAHEVKGHWEDDARVKIKVAAEYIPVKFVAVREKAKKAGGGYAMEEF